MEVKIGATKEGDGVLGLFHLAVIIIALALLPAALSVAMALGALANVRPHRHCGRGDRLVASGRLSDARGLDT
jgi:hypothetical protein